MTAIPTMETERLTLRAPAMADFGAYAAFCASPQSASVGGPWGEGGAFQRLAALLGHWGLRGYGRWMVEDRETGEPVGVVGPMFPPDWPEPEIAWTVFEAAEGRGFAHEAALAARAYVYDTLGWTRVVSCIAPDNPRSQRLAERLGAVREEAPFAHPELGDLYLWRHPSPEALQ